MENKTVPLKLFKQLISYHNYIGNGFNQKLSELNGDPKVGLLKSYVKKLGNITKMAENLFVTSQLNFKSWTPICFNRVDYIKEIIFKNNETIYRNFEQLKQITGKKINKEIDYERSLARNLVERSNPKGMIPDDSTFAYSVLAIEIYFERKNGKNLEIYKGGWALQTGNIVERQGFGLFYLIKNNKFNEFRRGEYFKGKIRGHMLFVNNFDFSNDEEFTFYAESKEFKNDKEEFETLVSGNFEAKNKDKVLIVKKLE